MDLRAVKLALVLMLTSGCSGLAGSAYEVALPPARQAAAAPLPAPAPIATAVPLPTVVLPTHTPIATPTPLVPEGVLREGEPAPELEGELVLQTYSIDFYWTPGGMDPDVIRSLGMPAELAIITDSAKIGASLRGRIAISFEPPQSGPCAIRGLTLSSERTIRLFYEPGTDPARVLAILAHEFVHQLQHDYYGTEPHLRSDVILLEGIAVWGSSAYFLDADGRPLYHTRARAALDDGTLLPLTYSLEADCRTTSRNTIYDQWASFVEFLLLTYGREKLDAVYVDSVGRPAGSSNYAGVYGKPLNVLEAEWIAWLAAHP